jgi:hypothetical protein
MDNREKSLFKEAQEAAKTGIIGEHFKEYIINNLDAKMAKNRSDKIVKDKYDKFEIDNKALILNICRVIDEKIDKKIKEGKFLAEINIYNYLPKKKILFIFDTLDPDFANMTANIIIEKYARLKFKTNFNHYDGIWINIYWS